MSSDARAFIAKGYSVFPLAGKKPLTRNGFKDATRDVTQIEVWEDQHGKKITGWGSADALIIDADGELGIKSYGEKVQEHGDLGGAPRVSTPGGGFHLYHSNPDGIPNRKLAPGLETRGEGGYAVLPGSKHPNGGTYEGDLPPLSELTPPPAWVASGAAFKEEAIADAVRDGKVPAGEPRHPHLVDFVGRLRGQGFGDEAIWAVARAYNQAAFEEPIPARDFKGRVQRMLDQWEPGDLLARLGGEPAGPREDAGLFYDPTERRRESYDPPAIVGLFYLGQRHVLFGESGCGKTWLLLAAVAEELKAGRCVLWVDTDDMGDSPLVDRLLSLGVTEEQVSAGLLYAQPEGRFTERQVEEMADLVAERGVRLVAFDSFNATMLLEGLDPNSTLDVEAFLRKLASPVCRHGAAFVAADHVVKNRENRQGNAYGSERKKSGATAMVEMQAFEPFGRGRVGRALLKTAKDRPGHLPPQGQTIGIFRMGESDGRVSWVIDPAHDRADDGSFRPTALMERVSRFLAEQDARVSTGTIKENVKGKGEYVNAALDRLVAEGYAEQFEGARNSKLYCLLRPYSELADDLFPTHSRPVPEPPIPRSPFIGERVEAIPDGWEQVDLSGGWD